MGRRRYVFVVAATMRRILVDNTRRKNARWKAAAKTQSVCPWSTGQAPVSMSHRWTVWSRLDEAGRRLSGLVVTG
jgi:hypothetical protein